MEQFHCKKCRTTQKFPEAYPGKTVYSDGICGDCGDKERASTDTPMTDKTIREKIYELATGHLLGFMLVDAILAIPEIKEGQELLEKAKEGVLVELHEDQTPPVSYWRHGVEIPISPEVHGRYFEHVWMKVKGLRSSEPEEPDEE